MKYAITGLLLFSSVLATPLFGQNENGNKGNKGAAAGAGTSTSPAKAGAGNAATAPAAATQPKPAAAAQPKPAAPMSTGTTKPKPAAPMSSGTAGPKPAAPAGAASETMAQAAANWAKDTAVVSNFLNLAPTLTGQDFVQQAQIALDAEVDELNHKAVLDTNPMITSGADVKGANATLVGAGKFQDVVDVLRAMVQTGDSVAQSDTDAINANRCVNVLPNIDIYLAAAGTNFKSTRPNACDATGVKQGGAASGNAASGATGASPAAAQNAGTGATSGTTASTGSTAGTANAGASNNGATAA